MQTTAAHLPSLPTAASPNHVLRTGSGAKPKSRHGGVFDLETRHPVFWKLPSRGHRGLCDLPGRPWVELLGMSLQSGAARAIRVPAYTLLHLRVLLAASGGRGPPPPLLCQGRCRSRTWEGDGVGADHSVLALGGHHGHDRLGQTAAGRVFGDRSWAGRRWRSDTAAVNRLGQGSLHPRL